MIAHHRAELKLHTCAVGTSVTDRQATVAIQVFDEHVVTDNPFVVLAQVRKQLPGLRSLSLVIQQLVLDSFLGEIDALKPGNVSRYADGHGMTYEDFSQSARLVTPVLCDASLGLGKRVLECVELTRRHVGCNTNLGMLLLFAPVLKAYETGINSTNIRNNINNVLQDISEEDSELVYRAIHAANPGGLGETEENDVRFSPDINLLEAMNQAAGFDMIARQYSTGYRDIHDHGIKCLDEFANRWNSVEWATVACYLSLLAAFPDSHIWRKSGEAVARNVQNRAETVFQHYINYKNPASAQSYLLEFDRELKESNLNPGTSADLTAVCLLIRGINLSSV